MHPQFIHLLFFTVFIFMFQEHVVLWIRDNANTSQVLQLSNRGKHVFSMSSKVLELMPETLCCISPANTLILSSGQVGGWC